MSVPAASSPSAAPLPAAATASPVREVWEFNGVVRLTRIGTTYVLSTVILAVAAINTGNNALYIAVSFMLGCLLLSGLASKGGLRQLEIEISDIDEAWAGRPASGRLEIRNRSRIWNVRDVVLTSEAFVRPVLIPILPSRRTIATYVEFLFPRRGRAQVNAIDSYTRYPFGFVLKKRRIRVRSEVVVFPHILSEEDETRRFRPEKGDQTTQNRRGGGNDIHSFREYSSGDSMRFVHWKKSAGAGRWIIKQTAADAARSLHVVVDPYRPPGTTDEAFEQMVTEVATFVFHATRDGFDVTLSLPRMSIRARESEPAAPLFRALALLEPSYEPVQQQVDRNAIVFSVAGGRDDAKSA